MNLPTLCMLEGTFSLDAIYQMITICHEMTKIQVMSISIVLIYYNLYQMICLLFGILHKILWPFRTLLNHDTRIVEKHFFVFQEH